MKLSCMACNVRFEGEEPQMCCSGIDCGCMGLPIEPVVCSDKCYDLVMNKHKPNITMTEEQKFTDLANIIVGSGVEQSTATSLKESFEPFYLQAKEWEGKAKELVVTDISQVDLMKDARKARLALKDIRVNVEKRRKELKEDSLKLGKAIDSAANLLKGLIEPIEAHLDEQEKFAERVEAERKAKVKGEREALLQPLGVNTDYFNLADMDEATFADLLNDKQNAYNQRIEDERRAKEQEELKAKQQQLHNSRRIEIAPYLQFSKDAPEFLGAISDEEFAALMQQLGEAKLACDNEQAAIRAENERLRKEQLEAAEALAAKNKLRNERNAILRKYNGPDIPDPAEIGNNEWQEIEYIAKNNWERSEKERVAAEQKAAEERAERERLAAELKAKEDAEAKRIADEAAAKEAELAKGDAQKVEDLKADLEALCTKYSFKSTKHKKLYSEVGELLNKTINHIIAKQ